MPRYLNTIGRLVKLSFSEWLNNKPQLLGGSLAFYIIFSSGPILVIMIWIFGIILGQDAAQSQLLGEIRMMVGDTRADVIQFIVVQANQPPSQLITTIMSVPIMMFGSAMLYMQLQNAMNHIWDVPPRASGITGLFRSYLFAYALVVFVTFLFILLVVSSSAMVLLSGYLQQFFPMPEYVFRLFDRGMAFLMGIVLFAIIFRFLPNVGIRWPAVWVGATVTSFLFSIGQFLIGFYITRTHVGSAYGAIGSLTILFIWVFYSSLIFLLGASFTRVYAQEYGYVTHM